MAQKADVRGIVISTPVNVDLSGDTGITFTGGQNGHLDPSELRFVSLYFDQLAWPRSPLIDFGPHPDTTLLEQSGILTRPVAALRSSRSIAESYSTAHLDVFRELELQQPGQWSLAQGDKSFLIKESDSIKDRTFLLELVRALPAPSESVAIADILDFKQKRGPELQRLRSEIDGFYSEVAKSNDPVFEAKRLSDKINVALGDLLRVTSERRFPIQLTDLKVSFQLDPGHATSLLLAWFASHQLGLPAVVAAASAAAYATASFIRVQSGIGFPGNHRQNPYWYAVEFLRSNLSGSRT